MSTTDIKQTILKEYQEKKQELKDWLYGTIYKQYDREETAETVQQDVETFFTDKWFEDQIDRIREEERKRIKDAVIVGLDELYTQSNGRGLVTFKASAEKVEDIISSLTEK